jgi:hypothetical protein
MTVTRRRTLELARADILERIGRAQIPQHRKILERALEDIDRQIRELG